MAGTSAQDEIRAVFDQLLKAQNAGDAEQMRAMLSARPDAVHIGTDADEWWTSQQVADAVAATEGGDGIQAVADDIDIHIRGDIAWVEGRGRFTNASGGARPLRMTGVLVREDGRWKIAQSHASIGVPNADIFG